MAANKLGSGALRKVPTVVVHLQDMPAMPRLGGGDDYSVHAAKRLSGLAMLK